MKRSVLKVLAITLGLSWPAAVQAGPILLPVPQPVGPADAEALLWLAQSCEGDCGGEDYGRNDGKSRGTSGGSLNKGTTNALVKIIEDANRTCGSAQMALEYRIDCLRIYYGWVADKLPDTGDYAPVKKAMKQAEAKLDRIVRANLDPTQETITPKEGYKKNAKRLPPVRAVKKSAAKKAARQAEAVVQETELLIIRSGEDPARRTPHFTAVAEAVDDNLVILRSA
ncbi:hypothetical protein G5B31_02015 [Rhodobacter sp. SGA-6-6]|uniref:hypothetical protein n=1 Tax=Rhodobacter sp. SGA-6-6 TaxID=2710882 RepID=UPI0013EA613D|nr:hypothetical protein [Rhodobacter sp. SGA-6-6]NGM44308.1 hypothetical protein [Rhodobacter sp. SGA-6-6]